MSPTRLTPAKFMVPLLMLTSLSSSTSACALRLSTASAIERSACGREGSGTAPAGLGYGPVGMAVGCADAWPADGAEAQAAVTIANAIAIGKRLL